MQERSVFPGRQRRQWLKVLFCAAAASIATLLFSRIPAVPPGSIPDNVAQLTAARYQQIQAELPSSPETLKALKQGVDRYLDKQYASALDILPDEQEAKSSLLGDYILLYRGKSSLMAGQYKEALANFRLLEIRYPDSPLIGDALTEQCQALLKLNEPKAVLAILGSSKIDLNPETLYLKAKAHQAAGEKEEAIELYLRVYSRYPGSKSSPLAERDLLSLSPRALAGSRNYGARLLRAENLLKAADVRKARTLLLALGRFSAPDSMSTEKRNLLSAEAEYRLSKTSTALRYLHKVTAADPVFHAKAIYLEGACCRRLDREAALITLRDKALELYPRSPDTEELCHSAAGYFYLKNDPGKALEAYKILCQAFPKGQYAERALWKLALYPYLAKNYGEAALGFSKYLFAYPNPLPAANAMYWMGRCYENLGDFGNARYLYTRARALANDSYYGQRAREAEAALDKAADGRTAVIPGIDFDQVVRTCNEIRHPPLSIPKPGEAAAMVVQRANALWTADLPEFALSELRWGSRRYPQEDKALSYIMSRMHASKENHCGAIAGLRRIFPDYISRPGDSLPDEVRKLLFPVCHWNTISSQADRTETDPSLILGIIRQESAFDERAQSRSNARGLMQILPSTGKMLARSARIKRYNSSKLFHAETNIILGTRHLASLLKRYGKTELALAAYNAGSGRIDRWLGMFGNEDMAQFVEQIPFGETRNYVKQVLSNKAFYDRMTSSSGSAAR